MTALNYASSHVAEPSVPEASPTDGSKVNPNYVLESRPLPSSPTSQDWIHIDPLAPLSLSPKQTDTRKEKSYGDDTPNLTTVTRPTLHRSASSQLRSPESDVPDIGVVDTNRIRLTYDAEGRRMVNQCVSLMRSYRCSLLSQH